MQILLSTHEIYKNIHLFVLETQANVNARKTIKVDLEEKINVVSMM